MHYELLRLVYFSHEREFVTVDHMDRMMEDDIDIESQLKGFGLEKHDGKFDMDDYRQEVRDIVANRLYTVEHQLMQDMNEGRYGWLSLELTSRDLGIPNTNGGVNCGMDPYDLIDWIPIDFPEPIPDDPPEPSSTRNNFYNFVIEHSKNPPSSPQQEDNHVWDAWQLRNQQLNKLQQKARDENTQGDATEAVLDEIAIRKNRGVWRYADRDLLITDRVAERL